MSDIRERLCLVESALNKLHEQRRWTTEDDLIALMISRPEADVMEAALEMAAGMLEVITKANR